jgi:hypothetical protein
MGGVTDRATVREAVAAAISDGDLGRAAALGSAQLPRGEDGEVLVRVAANGECVRDGKDLGLELAALLLRAKYANDHSGIKLANFRFALRLRVRARRQVRSSLRSEKLVIALASQSIAEWLSDRCEKCSGTGIRGARMNGIQDILRPCATCRVGDESTGLIEYRARGVRPDGEPAARAAAFRAAEDPHTRALYESMLGAGMDYITIQCPACRGMRYTIDRKRVHQRLGRVCPRCNGEGEALPRYADRSRALSVSLENYRRNWHQWFEWAGEHLTSLDKSLVKNLRCELGVGYSPAP